MYKAQSTVISYHMRASSLLGLGGLVFVPFLALAVTVSMKLLHIVFVEKRLHYRAPGAVASFDQPELAMYSIYQIGRALLIFHAL